MSGGYLLTKGNRRSVLLLATSGCTVTIAATVVSEESAILQVTTLPKQMHPGEHGYKIIRVIVNNNCNNNKND